jgi:hypothetical protein
MQQARTTDDSQQPFVGFPDTMHACADKKRTDASSVKLTRSRQGLCVNSAAQ